MDQSNVEPVAWQSQVRHEVAAFALLMERELRNNDHKSGWKEDLPDTLAQRAIEEATELLAIASSYDAVALSPVSKQTAERVASEAADVANMAMMVADVCGALPLIPPRPDASAGLIEAAEMVEEEANEWCVNDDVYFTLQELAKTIRSSAADRSAK